MEFVPFDEQTHVLGAGGNPDTNDLPICRGIVHTSAGPKNMFFSKMKLTDDEIRQIIDNDNHLFIGFMGETQPPMVLFTNAPWKVENYPFEIGKAVIYQPVIQEFKK